MDNFFSPGEAFVLLVWGVITLVFLGQLFRSVQLVPTRKAYIVERLGRYSRTLEAGFHVLFPFLDRVEAKIDLREEAILVPPQDCFTFDNVKVEVDGVIYISVMDPVKAAYGVTDFRYAAIQLAQTTTRSVIGTLDLDKTFEERDLISSKIVQVLSEAGQGWGIRLHRYEVKNIVPPNTVKNAMEKQVTAERERRAIIARSEGDKQSRINRSEGLKAELVNKSEGEMQRRINEAEGKAAEVRALADATADSLEKLGIAIEGKGGEASMELGLIERYLEQLGGLANADTQIIFPADLSKVDDLVASLGLKLPQK